MKNFKFLLLLIFGLVLLSACTKSHTVSFVTGSDDSYEDVLVEDGKTVSLPTPSKEGYTFEGWFKDEAFTDAFEDDDAVTEDLTLHAQWKAKTYTVRFMNGGEELAKQTVEHGKNATAPAEPEVVGEVFKGWDKAFTNVTKDLVVYAVFEALELEVKFMDGENQLGETQLVEYGQAAVAPTVQPKDGWNFKGWSVEFDNVTEDLVVEAQWERITYTVLFRAKSGMVLATQTVNHGEDAVAPTNLPAVLGYTFKEWNKPYTNVTEDLTVDPVYEVNVYTITYYKGAGSAKVDLELSPKTYTVEDSVVFPEHKEGAELFYGWYLNEDFSDERIFGIDKGNTGNVAVYLKVLDPTDTDDISYELNGGDWSWTTGTVTAPANGIKAVSTLPQIFMQDFYTWLVRNDLLEADYLHANLVVDNWADFSKNYDDPEALYNWASDAAYGGNYSTHTGYSQMFYDSGSGNEATGEVYDLVGGFLGSEGYKEKYASVAQHMAYLLKAKYTDTVNSIWLSPSSKQANAFVWDGYLYGTQGLGSLIDDSFTAYFTAFRSAIPTPTKGYKWNGSALEEVAYDFIVDEMIFGTRAALSIPSRLGYFFVGWYDNPELTGDAIWAVPEGQRPAAKYYAKWELAA